ncbi:transcription factor ssxt family-related [Anaeramoeba flamelloides]|uniref:Transcription factor ssxt family-related n=1 Tax=Anaeramoeba flamelloides TaxID=1746091 RepID=A0AAV7Y5T7_9EUKA|nr:transcription factor ssxt family-related [Anaeramoeba flamelloides]
MESITQGEIEEKLEEGKYLIGAIIENQSLGKLTESTAYLRKLQKNLVQLSSIADNQIRNESEQNEKNQTEEQLEQKEGQILYSQHQHMFQKFLTGLIEYGAKDLKKIAKYMGVTEDEVVMFFWRYTVNLQQKGRMLEAYSLATQSNLFKRVCDLQTKKTRKTRPRKTKTRKKRVQKRNKKKKINVNKKEKKVSTKTKTKTKNVKNAKTEQIKETNQINNTNNNDNMIINNNITNTNINSSKFGINSSNQQNALNKNSTILHENNDNTQKILKKRRVAKN